MRYVLAIRRPENMALTQKANVGGPTVVCDAQVLYVFQPAGMQVHTDKSSSPVGSETSETSAEDRMGPEAVIHWIVQSDPCQAILRDTVSVYYLGQDITDGVRTQHVQLVQMRWIVDVWVRMDDLASLPTLAAPRRATATPAAVMPSA
jgi:hypothetical protein